MDIGGSTPRMYTLETMKHAGTLVIRGMFIAYGDISCHMYQLPGTRCRCCVTLSQTIVIAAVP